MSNPQAHADSAGVVDHAWAGDNDGHNCSICEERDDSLNLCWPQRHLCFLCRNLPLAWPDTACVLCRERIARSLDTVTDPVELVLSSHQHICGLADSDRTMCLCGERVEGGPGFHRRHVARLIYEALGIPGPLPWVLGPDSATRDRPDVALYIDGKVFP